LERGRAEQGNSVQGGLGHRNFGDKQLAVSDSTETVFESQEGPNGLR
jgi:hypothetical protein